MKITSSGKNMKISDSLQERIEEKIGRFGRYFGDDATATVKVRPEKDQIRMEITFHVQNRFYRGETTAEDAVTALDLAVEVMEGQIRKHKTKLEKRVRDNAYMKEYFKNQTLVEDQNAAKIIKRKRFSLTPMDAEEAALQMEMLGHSFLLFLNTEDDKVNLVYKRKDGDYGLIEPDY
ncbi:MAG: ribosome hibernation-promoting factor, HPF/YfiA family [Saccharofermentanales bacterium]